MPLDRDGIAPSARSGWPALFTSAFRQSRNAMVLLDDHRRHVDVNGAYLKLLGLSRDAVIDHPIYHFVVGGPAASPEQWAAALAEGEFTGTTELRCSDGSTATVQWGATTEVVTGHRLVLVVVLSTSRWGHRFRREPVIEDEKAELTEREREVVGHVALGSTGPEIADELQIAHDTVRTHVRNAMTKVGARSRAHLVARALGDGMVLPQARDPATVVSTAAARHETIEPGMSPLRPDRPDPWPPDPSEALARLAVIVRDIDGCDESDHDNLLNDLLWASWPSASSQDQ